MKTALITLSGSKEEWLKAGCDVVNIFFELIELTKSVGGFETRRG